MSEGFQFLDIIFLAMVAGFIVLRLKGVLGRRTGNERPPREGSQRQYEVDKKDDNVVPLDQRLTKTPEAAVPGAMAESPLQATLTRIMVADRNFSVDSFIEGSCAAYGMIVTAFAEGDKEALRGLLDDQVYNDFSAVIDRRAEQNQTASVEFEGETKADLVSATLTGKVAQITVKFVSDLIRATQDADGNMVDGHPSLAREVTDVWTFSRTLQDRNPNWYLVSTRGAD